MKLRCLYCKELFESRRKNHVFCNDICQQANYRKNGTTRDREEHHPLFRCPKCEREKRLPFDPIKDNLKWLEYRCIKCNYKVTNDETKL